MKKHMVKTGVTIAFAASLLLVPITANAANQEGWNYNSTGYWYEYADGSYITNQWAYIWGDWYYFEGDGYIATNKWIGDYYLTNSGSMAISQFIDNYYVGADGKWIPDFQSSYTGGPKGDGWRFIDDKWYYYLSDGRMVTDSWIGSYNYVGPTGEMITNQWYDSFYFDENGTYLPDYKAEY